MKNKSYNIPWTEQYRPSNFEEILAHENILTTLQNFIDTKKFPHLIFYGPPGTGKTTTILACLKQLYNEGSYNILKINASEERGIDTVRNKINVFITSNTFNFHDIDIPFKIVMLDESDSMTQEAQSMLLSIIEKYTFNVRFCLICNSIKKIHPSIQSRCIMFKFKPLPIDVVKSRINAICSDKKITIKSDALDTLVKITKGDMRSTLNILQATSMASENIKINDISNCIGYPLMEHIDMIYKYVMTSDLKEAYNKISKIILENGYSLSDILNEIVKKLTDNFMSNKLNINKYISIISILKQIEINLSESFNDSIQLAGFVSAFNFQA